MLQIGNFKRILFRVSFAMTLFVFSFIHSNAQISGNGIYFQAIARDVYSNPAKDRKIHVQTTILQTTITGNKVLVEEHQTSTDGAGVFSLSIGLGTRVGGTMSNLQQIDWSAGPYFLNIKIAITPLSPLSSWDYTKEWIDIGTTQFGTVPYALYAGKAAGIDTKLNISDTSKMLSYYANTSVVNNIAAAVSTKLTVTDTTKMLAPYAKLAYSIDSNFFRQQLATKLSLTDTAAMLKNYLTGMIALNADTATLAARFGDVVNLANAKVKISDTAAMLINYLASLNNLRSTKLNAFDTTSMLSNYVRFNNLSNVATSGSYSDLTGKPTLFSGAYSDLTGKPSLFSGSYTDLANKPTLFSGAYSDLTGKPTLFSGSYTDLTNKPTLFSGAYSDLTGKPIIFSGSYTDLTNKPTIPAAQIQTDWTQTDNTKLDFVKNKPTLFSGAYSDLIGKPTLFSGSYTDLTNKPTLFSGAYSDLTGKPTIFSGSYTELTNKPTLFSGAYSDLTGKPTIFSGSYTDLANKPTIPAAQIQTDWTQTDNTKLDFIKNKPTLFSGSYSDLIGKPTLFSGAYSDLTGKPTIFSGSYTDLANKPTLFSGAYSDLTGKPNIFSGSYTDLANKPTIPAAQIQTDWTQTDNTKLDFVKNKPTLFSGAYSDLTGKPTIFSGSYTDLTNKPTLFGGAYSDLTGTVPIWNQNTTGTSSNVTGIVLVANGGTGATTLSGILKGNGTSAFTAATAGTDYENPLTFSSPFLRSTNTISITDADATHRGVVSTGTQSFAGSKTFNSDLIVNNITIGIGSGNSGLNTVFGNGAFISNSTGNYNISFGSSVLSNNVSGSDNIGIGWRSLLNNTTGWDNTSVGHIAMYNNTTGNNNTANGSSALQDNVAGVNNTAIGKSALQQNLGSYNTAIGTEAGYSNVNGSNNTLIGNGADITDGISNSTSLGNGAVVTTSNTIQLGNSSVSSVKTKGTITAGSVTYPNTLGTNGQVLTSNGTTLTWSNPSGTGISSLNALTGSSQTFAIGTSGTAPGFSSATSTHTLNIPLASTTGVTAGLISKTDYDVFNAKQSALTAGVDYLTPTGSAANLTSFPTLNQNTTGTSSNVTGIVLVANGGTGATTKSSAFDALSPMTTSGDIIYGGTSGTGTRLPKGTDGQILTLASGVPSWAAAPATGVTSVAMTVPTGLSISGSPITSSGILALSLASGYSIPSTTSQTNWDAAYTNRITSATSPLSIASNTISIGTVPVSSGGTGATTLTGILKGNGTSAFTAATAGTDYVAPSGTFYLGSTSIAHNRTSGSQSLTGITSIDGSAAMLTTPRSIYGNNFDGSAALTQIIASTYGGTGNGYTKFTGPTTSEKTFTLPDANASILTTNAAVTVGQGGTGATTLTGLVKGNGTSAFTAAVSGTDYSLVREVADEATATTGQTSFTLTQTPSANSKVKMYINGIRISNTAYSFTGTTLTYNAANNGTYALVAGDRIQFDYYY